MFRNFNVSETTEHLAQAVKIVASLNPAANIILTVSPVPLIATMEPRHVLQATTYSKSVLRVAAEQTALAFRNVHYFASYEIIAGTGAYFAEDRRSVTQEGIDHVMNSFFKLYADSTGLQPVSAKMTGPDKFTGIETQPVVCDEEEFFKALAAAEM
ncbi:MAG TPA: GSCFA domain-containing protein [Gemmataceae bacterium]|nr:GSCFA domain-containing protein [Gemmataceae bacterium]